MAKTSKTGHVKNVANFQSVITYLQSLGTKYNPSKPEDAITALTQYYTDADAAIQELAGHLPLYSTAVDNQEEAFGRLPALSVRVSSAYSYAAENEAAAHTIVALKNAISSNRSKKKGGDKAAGLAADGKEPEGHSTSQQSYDNLQQNFSQMVQTAAALPEYKPNEPDLKIDSLTAYATELKQKTQAVDKMYSNVLNARNKRNSFIYTNEDSIINKVKAIKKYLRSAFGPSSPELKYVNSFTFRGA